MKGTSALASALVIGLAMIGVPPGPLPAAGGAGAPGCQLASTHGQIQHVIYIQFDNVHFTRDDANVPSDLEQMPHLLNFIRENGTLLTNHHTVLISHTATGILSSLTGVYPDRMGQPVSNSFRYFTPSGATRTGVAFAYWTAPLFDPGGTGQTDFTPEMINENGKIAPAPWVPFTRAGCDFGAVGTANTILENTAIDIPTVFGPGSPEAAEVAATPGQAFADFVGIGVHCAQGSARCAAANHPRPDLLPDEPGGYTGFSGLFGAKYVDPAIGFEPPTDLDGNVIQDAGGHVGFPGFDGMQPTVSLAWVARMQEAGIPVTYAYISDAHDGHGTAGNAHFAYAPGEAGYVQQLRDYDRAFEAFFERLAVGGITKDNTLFVFTVDEGDHFVGDPPSNPGCDGVTIACTYDRVGEINANLRGLLATQFADTTPLTIHADTGPTVYVTGHPAPTDPVVRRLERESSRLTAVNPYTGSTDAVTVALADPVEEKTLHMVTANPARTPTFTLFGDANYFFFAGATNCTSPCVTIPPRNNSSFAWNHGSIQDDIVNIWAGIVGPGVRKLGDLDSWTDHTDLRPTMLALLGLADDYETDGRAVVEPLFAWAVPQALVAHRETLLRLGAIYKQLNAPFGQFGKNTLRASTRALASGSSADDSVYTAAENAITTLTAQRDALALEIRHALNGAQSGGVPLNEPQARGWIDQAQDLLDRAAALAAGP
ncbi:MAG: hypothetical protein E6H01_03560 [Bacillati bacterium ANGP1]|uniref:Alkaline phosphatase family protein n=1 Tax=Candidatus Segetimicrobium genomatis TaxID=2569760 RepID=A0A537LBM0_9BACT|nr:MAG: hypothetical protein E6H01_03560 [Terrabacteria group bacterium ANGP1]